MIGRRDFFFFLPALLLSILTPLFLPSSSVPLSYFILAVPMRECLGKHSCMSSPFPIAILNGTFFFRSVKAINNWKRSSAIKQILLLLEEFCNVVHILVYSMQILLLCLVSVSDTVMIEYRIGTVTSPVDLFIIIVMLTLQDYLFLSIFFSCVNVIYELGSLAASLSWLSIAKLSGGVALVCCSLLHNIFVVRFITFFFIIASHFCRQLHHIFVVDYITFLLSIASHFCRLLHNIFVVYCTAFVLG